MSPKPCPVAPEEEALFSHQSNRGAAAGQQVHGRSSMSGSSTDFERDPAYADFGIGEKPSGGKRRWKGALQKVVSFPAWRFLVVVLSLWGFIDITRRSVHALQNRPWTAPESSPSAPGARGDLSFYCRKNCGYTLAEAEAKGCVWDELEFRFTRPECINEETQQDFRKAGPGKDGMWEYAIDVDWTRHDAGTHGNINDGNMTLVTSDELLPLIEPGRTVWHSNLWHFSHCLWYWRKVSLARFDGTLLPLSRDEEAVHSFHCIRMLRSSLQQEHLTDQFKASFTF